MAETVNNILDKNLRRDVRRNTSNQIVSYTLPSNATEQYGLVKLPAIKEELNRIQFEKIINTNTTEFSINTPLSNIELIQLNNVILPQLTIVDVEARLKSLREKYNSRYIIDPNTNNGLYEIPTGFQNDYYPSKLPFNKVVSGQSQDIETGTFLITEELKESGYDLILTYRVTGQYRGTGQAGSGFYTMFDFDNADGVQSPKRQDNSKYPNIGYDYNLIPTPGGSGLNLTFNSRVNIGQYRINNSQMRTFDRWQVKSIVGSGFTYAIADGSYFDIEVVEPI